MNKVQKTIVGILVSVMATTTAVVVSGSDASAVGGGVISVGCRLSHTNHDDPIVFPGQIGAAHQHGFAGSMTTDANSTYASMTASTSSCPIAADTAGYWFPLIVNPDGTVLRPSRVNVYYRSPPGTSVRAFPADLRIIAGGDTKNPPRPNAVQRSLSYSCVDTGPFFDHPISCPDPGTITHIHFPNCLLAGATDSDDHRSHMVYGGKTCPTGYDAVPKVSFHIRYKGVKDGATLTSDQAFDAPGQSLHADFWNTWDQDALEFLVQRCLNEDRDCKRMTDERLVSLGFGG